ncbi:MAG: sterol desaturase family protein [Cyanobacteria bacterium P01_D01_bin.36]
MTPFDYPILFTFWLLIALTLRLPQSWQRFRDKPISDWLLDICGLIIQGLVIPALQIGLLYQVLNDVIPQWHNSITLSPFLGFLICTVLVDYAYYWNHRWLHGIAWPLHKVHHTVTQLDVFSSSRNSLWSSFFILYLWIHTLMLYVLSEPTGYLCGVSLTAMLDLWRHSRLGPSVNSGWYKWLSPWLVLPQDHALHHSPAHGCNFGANLKIWDRLHGTARQAEHFPKRLGIKTTLSFWQKLLYPFETP